MKREIKFRAWHSKTQQMLPDAQTGVIRTFTENGSYLTSECVYMQYTGYENVYEGDIVTCMGGYDTGDDCEALREVLWDKHLIQFVAKCRCHDESIPLYEFDFNKVVGNIYDNPDLLPAPSERG